MGQISMAQHFSESGGQRNADPFARRFTPSGEEQFLNPTYLASAPDPSHIRSVFQNSLVEGKPGPDLSLLADRSKP